MSKNSYESIDERDALALSLSIKTRQSHPEPMILKLFQLAFSIGGRLSPKITSAFAYKLWITSPRFKTPESERHAMESAIIDFHQIKNHKIATYSWGRTRPVAKPLVLLVHGWSGRGTQLGSFVEPLLDAGYRVLSFDAPAHGQSSGKQTTIFEIVDVILALQKHYGEFDSVISHSFGGPCTALAIQKGLKVKRFVAISPPATIMGLVTKFISALHINDKTGAQLIYRIENFFGDHVWHDLSMTTLVENLTVPGFVIHDTQDVDIPWEEGQAIASAWGNASFKRTDDLGHRRILRDDDVIASAVNFISAREATA
jgi:pimeloyl-ACP methyl ester carboxylesterase